MRTTGGEQKTNEAFCHATASTAADAERGVFGVAANLGKHAPAAFAFGAVGDMRANHGLNYDTRGDADIGPIFQRQHGGFFLGDTGFGLKRGANGFVPAHIFDRGGDFTTMFADFTPFFGQRVVAPHFWDFWKQRGVHANVCTEASRPGFFRREGKCGSKPRGEAAV